jgi:hypothetical protein
VRRRGGKTTVDAPKRHRLQPDSSLKANHEVSKNTAEDVGGSDLPGTVQRRATTVSAVSTRR